ncbi:MAG: MgtC/SapB family protein [Gemmatimonadota bacterium]|nr:MgtC/SapB family protein [Gemmatimonadota bacterium]
MGIEEDLTLLFRPVVAAVLCGIIGWEREQAGKAAGLRTHMLVGLAAALYIVAAEVVVARYAAGEYDPDVVRLDPVRVIGEIASGIGFLGAGTIFVAGEKGVVRGLTTAASIWATAAIGVVVGIERYVLALGTTALVLAVLHFLRRFDPDHPDPAPED